MSHEYRSLEQVIRDFWNQLFKRKHEIRPPWDEEWKLDDYFFKDLVDWDTQHRELTFLRVVEKIRDATITCKPFMELIPNAPFPARGLVLALSHFLHLGITVAQAKGEVFKFVVELSNWIVNIEANFEDGRAKFSSRARKNLIHIRDLVNEILTWGWSRLHDGRWETLIHGISIVEEIRDFNRRLRRAREMLSVLQDINTAMGLDEILQQIREIKNLRISQMGEILDHLQRSQLANERRQFLDRTLYRYALRDTGYDRQGKDPCDPDTRVEILATIREWVNDLSEGSQNFFWLTGDPGSGKSAITASFARESKDSGVLWAQFFINRNNESTTNPQFYFPTIACQMAEHIADPTVTVAIHEILRKKESLLDRLTAEQALEFFAKIVHTGRHVTLIETNPSRSSLMLERRNAKVFISSRTDDEITRPFYGSLQKDSKHVKHLHLNTSGSRQDVEIYLRRNLEYFVEKWVLDWKEWPGEERFRNLCDQAAGLFIWAATVVKFFREQLERHGRERRNRILNIFNEKGMGDVNNLYGIILEMTVLSDDGDEWEYERFRWIVGFIIALKEPLTIGDLSGLLDLRETPDSDPVDVVRFVTNLRTVLVAGTDNVCTDTIPRLHKSFVEYITSKRADPHFRIDIRAVDDQIAMRCLKLVNRLRNAGEKASIQAGSLRYATHNWTRHLAGEGTSESGVGVVGAEGLKEIEIILSTTTTLRKGLVTASGDYRTHMYDPKIGLPPLAKLVTTPQYMHSSTIQGPGSINAITMSSDSRLIASGDDNGVVQIWDSRSHERHGKAGKHDGHVNSVCFSPDSSWLVSASWDMTVRIWDCETGLAIGSPLRGHTSDVNSVCTDGRRIISGSSDKTIRIWSYDTRELIGAPIYAANQVYAVAVSNNDLIAAGTGFDVVVYDIKTRHRVVWMKGHTKLLCTVVFSPDGSQIASGSDDSTIRIWDVRTGNQTHRLMGHENYVMSVAFSPDGHWIASGGNDQTVRVWNSLSGQPVGLPLTGHTSFVRGVFFSPNSLQLFSVSYDRTIRIWSAVGEWLKPSMQITVIHVSQIPASSPNDRISLQGHPSVVSDCCSPGGSLYAASTYDGHVSIWNGECKLLWETDIPIYPIHLLRLSETQLVLSAPDGSTLSWNLLDGKPTNDNPISRRPQLNESDVRQSTNLSNDTVTWFPFDFEAGLWAFVDGCLIRFEREEGSITIVDLQDFLG